MIYKICVLAGWICYAEKQLGSYVLPYISSVKSPQQTIGVIVKNNICQKMGLRYFFSVLCFFSWVDRLFFVSKVQARSLFSQTMIIIGTWIISSVFL